ncbi:MAG: DUF3604 domain-containing protein [Sphingomonadales bacterium]
MRLRAEFVLVAMLAVLGMAASAGAQEKEYSPPVADPIPRQVYWGDLHLHTNNSADAYSLGTRHLTPAEAYRFALGEEMTAENGVKVKLARPLDFLAVSDHGEYLGVFARIQAGDPEILKTAIGKRWHGYMQAGENMKMFNEFVAILRGTEEEGIPEDQVRSIWRQVGAAADQFNNPGHFTAFVAYEFTSAPQGNNLHRVVIFGDGAEHTDKTLPFSSIDSEDPEKLWAYLENYEKSTGGRVLAIAHNGNGSNGLMFSPKTFGGMPLTRGYAQTRSRWEPLYEATQVKGDGETHPFVSPDDEFADYETWDDGNLGITAPKENWMLQYEYARSALREGLRHEAELGINPFKVGLVGSTDSHNGMTAVEENNFFGKFVDSEPSPERTSNRMATRMWPNWTLASSGLAAVWAKENTRTALFDAMKRKETYATTGSRITVRFFGGWSYEAKDVARPDYAEIGYRKGVPMGGDLANAPKGAPARFMVLAAKDPDGANLDRIQVVKGWLDGAGKTHEKVYDVALSDGRKVDPKTGKAPPVGSTVDVADASYTNTIGEPVLATVWTDPEFDPALRAFYYVRVLEIPTPRWTAYDARFYGLKLPPEVPMVTQDRAYTSPIWYTPTGKGS